MSAPKMIMGIRWKFGYMKYVLWRIDPLLGGDPETYGEYSCWYAISE
jgi:hypothetical protein